MGAHPCTAVRTLSFAAALFLLMHAPALAAPKALPLAPGSGWSVWQAESASGAQQGAWEVSASSGSGARCVQPQADAATLEFPFVTEQAETLRVKPVWWPTGEQKLSQRFPYPLVRQPGPDAIDYVGTTVFATAPAAGRVIAIDAISEQVLGATDIGGYLSDLVADRDANRLYVADALGDRVVGIDAASRRVLDPRTVPGGPWALAYSQGKLFVACREGKRLVVMSTTDGRVLKEIPLSAAPANLEVTGGPSPRLLVRYQPQAFDLFTLAPAPVDRFQFRPYRVLQNGTPEPPCPVPSCDCKRTEVAGPHTLARIGNGTGAKELVDVSAVTKGPSDPEVVRRFGENPGPANPAHVVILPGDTPVYLVGFTSPSRGLVGIMDADRGTLRTVTIGGYLSDLLEIGGNLFAIDAAGNRVVVIDPKLGRVTSEIPLPGEPWLVLSVPKVTWQRPDPVDEKGRLLWPPAEPKKLFVACRGTRDLVAIDAQSQKLAARLPLEGELGALTYAPPPYWDWWDTIADDRIPLLMQPRVIAQPRPDALDLTTLELAPAPADTPADMVWHTSTAVPVGGSGPKQFSAANQLVILADKTRAIDISPLADPQFRPDAALTAKDHAGSITISVDGGPEFDWAGGRWIAPDSEAFLVNDSEEFWRYNAPSFQVAPGRHTLRVTAHSRFARLDAVAVRRTPEPQLDVTILPEPRDVHGAVPLVAYQGVFYDQEPVRFTMWVANRGDESLPVRVRFSLTNYLGEMHEAMPPLSLSFGPSGDQTVPISLTPKDWGRFTLTVTFETAHGQLVKEMRFLRLPKLEHPRLFLRKEDLPAIQARVAQYPTLFRRYTDWLERTSRKEGQFPERFLPPDLTAQACRAVSPPPLPEGTPQRYYAGRNYELGWRVLAAQLTLTFLKPDSEVLKQKVAALRAAEKSDYDVQFHHGTPFFPGLDASMVDLAADVQQEAPKLSAQMAGKIGDMNPLAWTLVSLEEPLTPEKRALLYRIMNLEDSAERYFTAHAGRRGGAWWQNPYTGCRCPLQGYALMFLYLHNVFGEPRLFEKPVFGGLFTFQRYADPIRDERNLQPTRRGPMGEPWHWIFACLTNHPLEQSTYQWDEWLQQLNGPLPGDEQAAVGRLMALEGVSPRGPMDGEVNYFVTGVAVPMALALGWYDPKAPKVTWQEMPPTALFDVEGWAAMRSGFDSNATEVTFVSGVRDHTYRTRPNHLAIAKSGQYLLGTAALYPEGGDDGANFGAWANTVVVDDAWRDQWSLDLQQARDGEHMIINRFSLPAFTYLARDRLRFGYQAAEGGFGGGLDLHGHTETMFMREGRVLAYQTWPGLDFVAGSAENAWPVNRVSQLDRQVVFLKPDLVVVYDRVKLGPNGHTSRWIAATGPELAVQGDSFTIRAGKESLAGRALLPEGAVVSAPEPYRPGWLWKDQRLLEIAPAQQQSQMEYLVAMRVSGEGPLPDMRLIHDARTAGVALALGGRQVEVRLNRSGPVGGGAIVTANGRAERYALREAVEDDYRNWQSDPRYAQWTREARFAFVVPRKKH